MAFPKQHVLGVHIRVPKGQFKKVRKELLARVRPLPGERAETLAKRAKAESRDMGLQVSPDSDEILVLTPSDSEGSPGPAPVHRQGQQNLRQPAPSSQPPPAIGGERLAIQRNVASAIVSLYDARRRSAPRLRSQPRPAIGGTQADQHMEISAIGEECLAEQGPAHRTLALPGVSCHRESSGAATDSDGSMASGLAPWVDHNEQGFRFRPTEELGKGSFGKVFGGILEPIGQAVALKLLSRNPVRGEEHVSRTRKSKRCELSCTLALSALLAIPLRCSTCSCTCRGMRPLSTGTWRRGHLRHRPRKLPPPS